MSPLVDCNECSGREVVFRLGEATQYEIAAGSRRRLGNSQLDDARTVEACCSENSAKVEIVSEEDHAVVATPTEDHVIGSIRFTDGRPVTCLVSARRQKIHPRGREVHVDDDSHVPTASSNSSLLHAAYCSAARMSSGSRYGYRSTISTLDLPAATSPTMVPTVTRRPRRQGFPPITAGSRVIRLSSSMFNTTTTTA